MTWFEPHRRLKEMKMRESGAATPATLATQSGQTPENVADVANVAVSQAVEGEFEERAAILEFEAGYPRDQAEWLTAFQVYG